MSQFVISDSQPGDWEELNFFLCRLEVERFQEYGWQEPYESRGSCFDTLLHGTDVFQNIKYNTFVWRYLLEITMSYTIIIYWHRFC